MVEPSQQIGKGRTLTRIGAGVSLMASLLHCGSGTTAPPPAPRVERPAPAPSTEARPATPQPAASPGASAADKPAPAKPAAPQKDPTIAAMSPDERYALARARLPRLAELLRETPELDFSRFGKEGATVALYVPESLLSHGTNESKRCRRVVFEVHPDRLSSEVPTNGGEGRPKLPAPASFEEIALTRQVTTYATASRSVERNAKGERIEVGQGVGGFENHGGELLEIRDDAIAYGAVPVGVRAICVAITEEPCMGDKGSSACERCTRLDAALSSRAPGYGFGHAGPSRTSTGFTADKEPLACSACPADTLTPEIPRINQALEGMTFYTTVSEPWPVISRKKATCEAAERARTP